MCKYYNIYLYMVIYKCILILYTQTYHESHHATYLPLNSSFTRRDRSFQKFGYTSIMEQLIKRVKEAVVFVIVLAIFPQWWCGRHAGNVYQGLESYQIPLAQNVAKNALKSVGKMKFKTGSSLFNAEWELVTCQMTVLGLGQVLEEHPEKSSQLLPAMETCLDWMLSPQALSFGASRWNQKGKPIEQLKPAAYLGYINMALGMHRQFKPASKWSKIHDQLSIKLINYLENNPLYTLQTYPHESYPADISTVLGSIGLHAKVSGQDHSKVLNKSLLAFKKWAIEPTSGLVYQSLNEKNGQSEDEPRASGTAFSTYFLSFVDQDFSHQLYAALKNNARHLLGFGGIKEYLPGSSQSGDIDSGPVIAGIGTSATGFSLAGARIHQDLTLFKELYRTSYLFGAPRFYQSHQSYLLGGSLGNAIMLTMLSAHRRPS